MNRFSYSFKFKDIMNDVQTPDIMKPQLQYLFNYDVYGEYKKTTLNEIVEQGGYALIDYTDDDERFLYRLLKQIYLKYHNYDIAFSTVSAFLCEFILRLNKELTALKLKYTNLIKLCNITDDDIQTIRKDFMAFADNNAEIDATDNEQYISEILGYVNTQTGRKVIDNKFLTFYNYYKKISNDTLLDFIESLKTLFVLVGTEKIYIYER